MSPRKNSFWLPLTRLTAFFVAVVVTGTVFLRLIRPSDSHRSSDGSREASEKRRKKLKKNLQAVHTLLQATGQPKLPPPPPSSVPPQARAERPIFDVKCSVCELSHELPRRISDPLTFFEFHRSSFYEDLPIRYQPLYGWVDRVGNGIFGLPDRVIDAGVDLFRELLPDSPANVLDLEQQGILERFFDDVEHTRGGGNAFARFLDRLVEQEVSYFSRFRDLRVIPEEFQDEGVIDDVDLIRDQGPILLSALQRTYFDRFRSIGARASDAAHRMDRWRGLDYAVAPTLILGTAWFTGVDRRFKIGPTRGKIHLDPIRDFVRGSDRTVALGIEWGWKDFPVRLLVSFGWHDGDAEFEFIGIGTDLNQVKKLLELAAGR